MCESSGQLITAACNVQSMQANSLKQLSGLQTKQYLKQEEPLKASPKVVLFSDNSTQGRAEFSPENTLYSSRATIRVPQSHGQFTVSILKMALSQSNIKTSVLSHLSFKL